MSDSAEQLLNGLKALSDPTRLRLLAVCSQGEWTVSELVQVLGQSQPRISRHLRVMAEAGLLERFREGSWVFYRRSANGLSGSLAAAMVDLLPIEDDLFGRDLERLEAVRGARRRQAALFFDSEARLTGKTYDAGFNSETVADILTAELDREPARSILDVGTGAAWLLRTLAPHVTSGVGVDISRDMLNAARSALDEQGIRHCHVRHGDMYDLRALGETFDLVCFHQVLHFADDPRAVLLEACRVLEPGGRIVIADLEAHGEELLRERAHHRRLGFSRREIEGWCEELGLVLARSEALEVAGRSVIVWVAASDPRATGPNRPASLAPAEQAGSRNGKGDLAMPADPSRQDRDGVASAGGRPAQSNFLG